MYYNTTEIIEVVYSNNTFESTITNLNEDTPYNFSIYANTSAGAGNSSFIVLGRTREDRKC